MPRPDPSPPVLWKRQAAACVLFAGVLAAILAALTLQHRQREWDLRREQVSHRLELAYDLLTREWSQVASDAYYLSSRPSASQMATGDSSGREELAADLRLFAEQMRHYDQLRMLDFEGHETVRINYRNGRARVVADHRLQDKSQRYYFQAAQSLAPGELFVSEFDLNLEHGRIEHPLNPVIRIVAPIVNGANEVTGFLVMNYLGAQLFDELAKHTLPGETLLVRGDGHYIRGPKPEDAWGWLLDHDRTFTKQFPGHLDRIAESSAPQLTQRGLFAARQLPVGVIVAGGPRNSWVISSRPAEPAAWRSSREMTIVSYLPRAEVFAASNELLRRLLILGGGVFLIVLVFSRPWARATLLRKQQAARIAASEERLRDLSSRLLRIQEEERRAISREIHDQLGQQATAINLDLKLAERKTSSEPALGHLQRAIEANETLLQTLHAFAKRIRPALLDDLGLQEAIESHLAEFHARTGVQVEAQVAIPEGRLAATVADNAFRLIQESLNNVAKHADAAKVEVEIGVDQENDNLLQIVVADNGRGHVDLASSDRLGLIGMQERVDLLHGDFWFSSEPDVGTRVEIRLPLSPS